MQLTIHRCIDSQKTYAYISFLFDCRLESWPMHVNPQKNVATKRLWSSILPLQEGIRESLFLLPPTQTLIFCQHFDRFWWMVKITRDLTIIFETSYRFHIEQPYLPRTSICCMRRLDMNSFFNCFMWIYYIVVPTHIPTTICSLMLTKQANNTYLTLLYFYILFWLLFM